MTDQNIPAGLTRDEAQAVREWAERARAAEVQDATVAHAARVLLDVLPPRPTLADMTLEERRECKRAQADVAGEVIRPVIINPFWADGAVRVMWPGGLVEEIDRGRVTPRPDLPRLEWPHTYQEAKDTTPAKIGDVIESADDPRLAALPTYSALADREGDVVVKGEKMWAGDGYTPIPAEGGEFGPWKVLHIAPEADQ